MFSFSLSLSRQKTWSLLKVYTLKFEQMFHANIQSFDLFSQALHIFYFFHIPTYFEIFTAIMSQQKNNSEQLKMPFDTSWPMSFKSVCFKRPQRNKITVWWRLVEHEAQLPRGSSVWGGLRSGSSGLQLVGESSDRCGELHVISATLILV